jgi:hypothetical protein
VILIANSIQDFETEQHRYVLQKKMRNGFIKIAIVVFTKLAMENFSWQLLEDRISNTPR